VTTAETGVRGHGFRRNRLRFGLGCAVAPASIMREHLGASRLRSLRSPLTRSGRAQRAPVRIGNYWSDGLICPDHR
jgi:hypothetical protein